MAIDRGVPNSIGLNQPNGEAPPDPRQAPQGRMLPNQQPTPPGVPPNAPQGMPEAPAATFTVQVRRTVTNGRLRVMAVRPEEALVNGEATDWDDPKLRFFSHRREVPRSTLIEEGYDYEAVMEIPAYTISDWYAQAQQARLERGYLWNEQVALDPTMQTVEVFECYVKCDYDGDGIAEWRQVVTAGPMGTRKLLSNILWEGDIPFCDLRPMRYPHRWQGRSVWDLLADIQRIKTVLWRQSLDNLYLQNHPQTIVDETAILNPDEVLSPSLGGVIRVRGNVETAIRERQIPFVARQALETMDVLDAVVEKRIGVSRQTQQLDPDALQNQTATAVQAAQSAAYSRIEMIARHYAEGGMKRLFQCILRLIIKHQDRARTIRLRGKWVEMDPRLWDATMDVTVNTGLGTGSRDRDMAMLTQIMAAQTAVLQQMGIGNPLVGLNNLYNTLAMQTKTAGLKDVDLFFNRITPEQAAQAAQQQNSQPDPEQQKLQMKQAEIKLKAEAEQARVQASIQAEQQKAAVDAQAQRDRAVADLETTRAKAEADLQIQRERLAMEMDLQRQRFQDDMELERLKFIEEMSRKREEMRLEAELTREANAMKAKSDADTNIEGRE